MCWLRLCVLPLFLAAAAALAAPAVGEQLPEIRALDVDGNEHLLRDLLGPGPTLLVAITDRKAGDAMHAWFDEADRRAPRAQRVSIISVGVPFFVSDAYARSKARDNVPEKWRSRSLFDSEKGMARALRLGSGTTPWVFVVDPAGRVLARVHGTPADPAAARIWEALAR